MKFHTRKRRNPTLIILPLIDILAILLIFFIVTSTFKKVLPQLEINLPDSKTALESPARTNEPLILSVKSETEITLDDRPVAMENLAEELRGAVKIHPERPLAMQGDREAAFGLVVRVLDAIKEAGIEHVPAFTQPSGKSEP